MSETYFALKSTAPELLANARELTGIDILDTEIEEALNVLVPSLNTEASLSRQGALDMEARLLRILSNRLRMLRDFAAHPEIEDEVILPPVFLTGAPRTGSTKLHQLLSASGDFRYLPFWQAHNMSLFTGDRAEDPAPRIEEAHAYVDWVNKTAPQIHMIHSYSTFAPEEDTLIYEQLGLGFFIITCSWVPSFAAWYWQADFSTQVVKFVRVLKYLQWQFPENAARRWLLKYPAYQGFEPMLEKYFPGASFVTSNRDPTKTISSMVSLMVQYQSLYSDAEGRGSMLGPFMVEGQRQRLLLFMKSRAENPDVKLLDISYTDLTGDVEKVIDQFYAFTKTPLSETARKAMLNWESENAQHKHGVHRHNLAEIKLTPEGVQDAFRPYIDAYGSLF